MANESNGVQHVERVEFRLGAELLELIDNHATAAGQPRNEFMAKTLAAALGHPKLGDIPRISIGRPRKPRGPAEPAAAS